MASTPDIGHAPHVADPAMDPIGALIATPRGASIDLAVGALPSRRRPDARFGVLDATEWFGATSGGIRTYLIEKARYVEARAWLRQSIVVPGSHDAIAQSDGVRMYRLKGPRIPRSAPYRFLLSHQRIARIVDHEAPDIVEVGSAFVAPWVVQRATRMRAVPRVCFFHSNIPRQLAPRGRHASTPERSLFDISWRYMRRLDRMFALTIASSAWSASELSREGITRVARVPLGVDLTRFHPARRESRATTRATLGLPEGPLAGFVGRFAGEKGLRVLLDAWASVERRTGARLVLVGAGPMEARLRAHPYGERALFLPFHADRDRLADLYAAFDVLVAPGSVETFGLSALEALASGTPVLSSDAGGVAEQVTASGAGRLFAAGDAGSLAEEASALLEMDLGVLGDRARAHAEREHSWERVFDMLFDVYRGVVEGHGHEVHDPGARHG